MSPCSARSLRSLRSPGLAMVLLGGALLTVTACSSSDDGGDGTGIGGTGVATGGGASAGESGKGGASGGGKGGTSTTGGTSAKGGGGGASAKGGSAGTSSTGGTATGGGGSGAPGKGGSAGAPGKGGTSSAGTGGTNSTGGTSSAGTSSAGGTSSTGGGSGACLGSTLLDALAKKNVLVGASMSDATAAAAPFDLRYQYLSGGLFDGAGPCNSCASGCTAGGTTCANSGPGCSWWGCWQYDQDPPGAFVKGFLASSKKNGQIPWITYYQELQGSGASEGTGQVSAAKDAAFMGRYFADFRFLLQTIGTEVAFLHHEPDFWGYLQQAGDAHAVPVAVASANPEDCAGKENSSAGLGQCLIAMTRKYAPNAKIGLHASGWSSNMDVLGNGNASLDVGAEAKKTIAFLLACGADQADFVVSDMSDRDAGYYQSIGKTTWWDDTNAKLPNFYQAFAWGKDISEGLSVPLFWWQTPVGNAQGNDTKNHYKDNRVDYLMTHLGELSASHAAGVLFGAGDGNQTTPESDGGNLIAKVTAYGASGGQPLCP